MKNIARRTLCAWIFAVLIEYLLLSAESRSLASLDGLAQMSLFNIFAFAAAYFLVSWALSDKIKLDSIERYLALAALVALVCFSLISSFSVPFLFACILLVAIFAVYAVFGHNEKEEMQGADTSAKNDRIFFAASVFVGILFFIFISIWTVNRVRAFAAPTYDFGIFAQMFHSMKTHGVPNTTLERAEMLSHFKVHVSPIWYLMLPFYCIFPEPETLQVLQALVMASSVIPLYLISRRHGLRPYMRFLVCLLLLLLPAFSGGVGYDVHENCFLSPLLLWMLYGIDSKNIPITAVFAVLTLTVKEDAAVYVAVCALYMIACSLVRFERKKLSSLISGVCILIFSVAYFFAVTTYLAKHGDGVMTYRYDNFMYDGGKSLITVIKSVILCPMKAIFECVNAQKLKYIAHTMLPLLGLPFLTRRYERFILLIPYLLVNLMSDYTYQHDVFFQYGFGSTALLIYLVAVNVADIKIEWQRITALACALCVSCAMFISVIMPTATVYSRYYRDGKDFYVSLEQYLDEIPDGASVSTTVFYTPHLSKRDVLYDIYYASLSQILSTEYVIINTTQDSEYKKFEILGQGTGCENLISILEDNGYELVSQYSDFIKTYKKQ